MDTTAKDILQNRWSCIKNPNHTVRPTFERTLVVCGELRGRSAGLFIPDFPAFRCDSCGLTRRTIRAAESLRLKTLGALMAHSSLDHRAIYLLPYISIYKRLEEQLHDVVLYSPTYAQAENTVEIFYTWWDW